MRYPKQLFQRNLKLVQGFGLLCLCAWWLMAAVPVQAAGKTCRVGPSDADYTTIQGAVNDSACLDILVDPGTYKETVEISVGPTYSVRIYGSTSGSTIVDGNNAGTVFRINYGIVRLTGLTIQNGGTKYGGGIYNGGILTVNNITFNNNQATGRGGGIYNTGDLTMNNSTFSNNRASAGGGIYNDQYLEVNSSTFNNNSASFGVSAGGGIYNGGILKMNNSTFNNNSASAFAGVGGGGIYNTGDLEVNSSTFNNNNASFGASGGGIYNAKTMTVNNSTLNSNKASAGGGIYNTRGRLTVNNSTLSGNVAHNAEDGIYDGGGIYNDNTGTLTVNYSTIVYNIATRGSGIYSASKLPGNMTLNSTIIANVPDGNDCQGMTNANSRNNLIKGTSNTCGLVPQPGTIVGQDPKLGPLALNGPGTTATHALLAGSPAIDKGDVIVCNIPQIHYIDQRGVDRSRGEESHCDIGAYEALATGQVDSIAPETNLTRQDVGSAAASFTFSGSDRISGVASYQCRLDNAAFAACTSPQSYNNLSVNTHTFQVRAVDAAGNVDASPASYSWTAGDSTGCYQIQSAADNRLLTVSNNNVGAALKVATVQTGNALQLWNLRSDGAIVSLRTKYVVDVNGVSTAMGAAAIVYPENVPATLNQRWSLNQRENGYVAITTKLNGYVLDVSGQDGVSVILYPEKTTGFANQRWLFVAQPTAVCTAATVPTVTSVAGASLMETSTEAAVVTTTATMVDATADAEEPSEPARDEVASPAAATAQIFLPLISQAELSSDSSDVAPSTVALNQQLFLPLISR